MIRLFPKYQMYCAGGITLCFLIGLAIYRKSQNLTVPLIIFICGSFISFLLCSAGAARTHKKFLSILYNSLKPKEFIAAYSYLIDHANVKPKTMFSMLCFLSNGYEASGEFDNALWVLDRVPALPEKSKQLGGAILAGNRCNIYCANGFTQAAKEQLNLLEKLIAGGVKSQDAVKKVLEIKIRTLDQDATQSDADYVREEMKNASTRFYRLSMTYLLAEIYAQIGESDFAKAYFEEVSTADSQLRIVKNAKEKLSSV